MTVTPLEARGFSASTPVPVRREVFTSAQFGPKNGVRGIYAQIEGYMRHLSIQEAIDFHEDLTEALRDAGIDA